MVLPIFAAVIPGLLGFFELNETNARTDGFFRRAFWRSWVVVSCELTRDEEAMRHTYIVRIEEMEI